MIQPVLNLQSTRARKARLASRLGKSGGKMLLAVAAVMLILGAYCFLAPYNTRLVYICFSLAAILAIYGCWHLLDLRALAPIHNPQTLDDILEQTVLASLKPQLSPQRVWELVMRRPEAIFICNHLLLDSKLIAQLLSNNQSDIVAVWQQAISLTSHHRHPEVHAGTIAVAILTASPDLRPMFTQLKISSEDVVEVLHWLNRQLRYIDQPKPDYGGIGRDWASGFTPMLEKFGRNITNAERANGSTKPYTAHTDRIHGIVGSLAQGSSVALVGAEGSGKTSLVQGLAQHLAEGREPQLQYYQVISLDAALILSYSGTQLERLLLTLFQEAALAGNTILFLDDAQLFFGSGTGAFDMSQVLLPVLKNNNCKIIAAFTPADWQTLLAAHPALASSFVRFAVTEPSEMATMHMVQDSAMFLEYRGKAIITLQAIQEAYRLSGQYMQEQAYPGKAITLVEQSMPYADNNLVTAETIQQTIEKTRGVRVAQAQAPEAEILLHLEDYIHERMINQKRAVEVVASALRRGRAGVSSPNRPVGSFLFLGPTGVGKTELARSLAATYYGDEHNMIRLDMSEYQQPQDVARILAAGGQTDRSLLLAIREQPFSVVLLDEIEKAHPTVLNLLLQMLDEGQLTDSQGGAASFRSSIIIATSNAGAADITARVQAGGNLDDFERPLIDSLIASGQFKPELLNRFDEIVLFRPLTEDELAQVAQVMIRGVNKTLEPQRLTVELTPEALQAIVHAGYDPEFGARPMRRIIQKTVENAVAVKILQGSTQPGDTITLDVPDISLEE